MVIDSGKSLTNKIKPKGFYIKFVSDSLSLHIDKIHKKQLIIPDNSNFVIKILQILPKMPIFLDAEGK